MSIKVTVNVCTVLTVSEGLCANLTVEYRCLCKIYGAFRSVCLQNLW